MRPLLWDMHVHLDFMNDAREITRDALELGLGMLAVTVTPQGYLRAAENPGNAANVRVCAGLHPWWVADGRCGPEDAALTAELARNTRYVGEIGLDFSPKHVPAGSFAAQTAAFETVCAACAGSVDRTGPKILSLHAVKAAGTVLDILERTGCLGSCRCIFHWFTGSNEELTRAVKAGCLFSVNRMMLKTGRGREYARQLPGERLLLETDLPPGENVPFSAAEILAALEDTAETLKGIRGKDMTPVIRGNSERLPGLAAFPDPPG